LNLETYLVYVGTVFVGLVTTYKADGQRMSVISSKKTHDLTLIQTVNKRRRDYAKVNDFKQQYISYCLSYLVCGIPTDKL
jgi:hypothetical protein